jgi:uncharacterized protein (TIGR03437 family)
MLRALVFLMSLGAVPVFGGNVQLLSSLPHGAVSETLQLDAAGNIYVAGYLTPQAPKSQNDTRDVFVAKVAPDGSKLLYSTVLAGSSYDTATALALGSDGSAYVTGFTASSDFPVTAGALQPTLQVSILPGPGTPTAFQGFLVKLNPAGAVVYGTFLGGTVSTRGTGIAVNTAGEVFVTGSGGPGIPAISGTPVGGPGGFVLKLDAGLSKVLLSANGYGGGLIALDNQSNIYIAGSASPNIAGSSPAGPVLALPPLPAGAFQSTHAAQFCSQTTGPSGFATNCSYQYVAKLDATGTKLLWGTYVTGTCGAIAAGMEIDNAGNVIVAGTTNSDDYPVTPGAFQTAYAPAAAPPPNFGFPGALSAPPATGYVTKINAAGTGLAWSTYFGGSYADHITGMAFTATGVLFLSGRAGSSDLPVLTGTPDGCRPSPNQVLGFVARMAPDGATAGPSQLVYGAPDCLYSSCNTLPNYQTGWPLALRPDGTAIVAGVNGSLAAIDFSSSIRLACIIDPTDNAQLATVAPGQLVSLFGTDLAPAAPFVPSGGVAQSSDRFGVFFNGVAAPILYSSAQQINVQVPFEIAEQTTVQIQVISKEISVPVSETHTLRVVQRQPSVFLSPIALESPFPGLTVCGNTVALGEAAVALNADGTLNDCANPAIAGSVVTVFLNGLGPVNPAQPTGIIAPAPAVALTPGVDANAGSSTMASATTTVPGAISSVGQVQLQLPQSLSPEFAFTVTPTLAGTPLRERTILIWTLPN